MFSIDSWMKYVTKFCIFTELLGLRKPWTIFRYWRGLRTLEMQVIVDAECPFIHYPSYLLIGLAVFFFYECPFDQDKTCMHVSFYPNSFALSECPVLCPALDRCCWWRLEQVPGLFCLSLGRNAVIYSDTEQLRFLKRQTVKCCPGTWLYAS